MLNALHSQVDKSNINKQFDVYNSQGNPDDVAGDFGRHSLYKMLGYFSLVGLLRLPKPLAGIQTQDEECGLALDSKLYFMELQ